MSCLYQYKFFISAGLLIRPGHLYLYKSFITRFVIFFRQSLPVFCPCSLSYIIPGVDINRVCSPTLRGWGRWWQWSVCSVCSSELDSSLSSEYSGHGPYLLSSVINGEFCIFKFVNKPEFSKDHQHLLCLSSVESWKSSSISSDGQRSILRLFCRGSVLC